MISPRMKKLMWWSAGLAALATLAVTLIYLNLTTNRTFTDLPKWVAYDTNSEVFERSLESLLGPPVVAGNDVTPYDDSKDILDGMLAAIQQAEHHVHFETYIFSGDRIGQRFIDAFSERARAGVDVRVILDWMGTSEFSDQQKQQLDDAGVQWEFYRPLKWYHLEETNERTHRKILVVDGVEAWVGGVGISALWPDENYRELHFRVRGPIVNRIQGIFADNWMKTHKRIISNPEFFPSLQPQGDMLVQAFKSSGNPNSENVRMSFALLIASARDSIRIGTPYFVPDKALLGALVDARDRGVMVEVVVPGKKNDSDLARWATRATWGELLRNGVEIYEYQPHFYHSKLLIVDDRWVSVGSANFDKRSFMFNDENNINVKSNTLAREMIAIFEEDKTNSNSVSLEAWENRPWQERIAEAWARMLSGQL